MQTFHAEILKDTAGRLTYLPLPFSAREIFHQPKGTIYVQGTINGIPYRSRLLSRGSGCYIMLIDKVLQKSLGFCGLPLPVSVTMSLDAPAQPSGSPAAPSPSLSPCAMDTITAVKTRTSVRHYTDAPITPDALNTLLYAGMCAPSAKKQKALALPSPGRPEPPHRTLRRQSQRPHAGGSRLWNRRLRRP